MFVFGKDILAAIESMRQEQSAFRAEVRASVEEFKSAAVADRLELTKQIQELRLDLAKAGIKPKRDENVRQFQTSAGFRSAVEQIEGTNNAA